MQRIMMLLHVPIQAKDWTDGVYFGAVINWITYIAPKLIILSNKQPIKPQKLPLLIHFAELEG